MPLVASDGEDEAFGSPSRFRDGVDPRACWANFYPDCRDGAHDG